MTGEIKIFEKEEFGKVRTLVIDNEPWFVGKDVASILAYQNTAEAVNEHVDEEDRKLLTFKAYSKTASSLWSGNDFSNKTLISEGGVYSLIMGSRLESAKKFKHWVTHEVLPSIRKTGTYNLPQDYLSALKALIISEEQKQTLALENAELKPKAEYYDKLCERENLTNFRDTAKQMGIKVKELIDWLLVNNYIYREKNNKLKPCAEYTRGNKEYFKLKDYVSENNSRTGCQTLITAKGKLAIIEKYNSKEQWIISRN